VQHLFQSSYIGLALYKPDPRNSNLFHVGQGAGKIFYYFRHGIPCIVTSLPGLRELVTEDSCGIDIFEIAELGNALRRIAAHYDIYSYNALKAFPKYEFMTRYQSVLDSVDRLLTISLE